MQERPYPKSEHIPIMTRYWSLTRYLRCGPTSSASAAEGGKAKGLPAGVALGDLVPAKTEPIPATHDAGNPEVLCEFFDTRQVCARLALTCRIAAVQGLGDRPQGRWRRLLRVWRVRASCAWQGTSVQAEAANPAFGEWQLFVLCCSGHQVQEVQLLLLPQEAASLGFMADTGTGQHWPSSGVSPFVHAPTACGLTAARARVCPRRRSCRFARATTTSSTACGARSTAA